MMNNLNSILIEGTLVCDAVQGESSTTLTIANNRYVKTEEGFEKETYFFRVETYGKLANACLKYAKKDRGCRVVGRLVQDSCERIFINAEHVEFRPVFTKEEKGGKL